MKIILFFVAASHPSKEQLELADKLRSRGRVSFRNALVVKPSDRPEKCDFVVGDVPTCYLNHPTIRVIQEDMAPARKLNKGQMIAELKEAGHDVPAGLSAEEVRELYATKLGRDADGDGDTDSVE